MRLTLSWQNPGHVLLNVPLVLVDEGSGPVSPPVGGGQASIALASGSGGRVRVQIGFKTTLGGGPVLVVDQDFTIDASSTPVPAGFRIPDVTRGGGASLAMPGLNPLLTSSASAAAWQLAVDTRVVDVSDVNRAALFGTLASMLNPGNDSRQRVLARTDGVLPAFWLACVPRVCRASPASDVLCFFTPPQTAPGADVQAQLTTRAKELAFRLAVFLGSGQHAPATTTPIAPTDLRRRLLDHELVGSADVGVLARGWDQAVHDSSKRCALVLPVPASSGFGEAGGAKLPSMLKSVHAVLHAHGFVAPPAGTALGAPRLALGAHSNGGGTLFDALRANLATYVDLLLFEPQEIQRNLDLLVRAPARVALVGYAFGSVVGPFASLTADPAVAPRVRLLPVGYPGDRPDLAPLADVVARSPDDIPQLNPISLGHAIAPLSLPAIPKGALLHQYVAWGGDDLGAGAPERHFLTQALDGSTLR